MIEKTDRKNKNINSPLLEQKYITCSEYNYG
jgi:hypothetical protein